MCRDWEDPVQEFGFWREIGTVRGVNRPGRPRRKVVIDEKFKGTIIERWSNEMELPPTGAAAELQSFRLQAERFVPTSFTVPEEVLNEVAEVYPKSHCPKFIRYWMTTEWDEQFKEAFINALRDMDPDTTPGAFWDRLAQDNSSLLSHFEEELYQATKQLCETVLTHDLRFRSAEDIFRLSGVVYKLFVKGELHTVEKLDEGRQRLVFSSPIHMTLLERLFFGPQNKMEINNADSIPSKAGISMNREGALALERYVDSTIGSDLASDDQRGFDWHVQEWLLDADTKVRMKLLHGTRRDVGTWYRGATNLTRILSRKTVCLSDGTLFAQTVGGVMPSGSYRTSSTNSRNRLIVRVLACGDTRAITMGDDAVEGWLPDLVQRYAKYGFELKPPVKVRPDEFEFCSKWFRSGVVVPVDNSARKMILGLIRHHTYESNLSITLEMVHHHLFDEMVRLGVIEVPRVLTYNN